MRCIVTAGPTYEHLDNVRRLTNFSTGRLGGELANFLAERGHDVTLLIGAQATWRGERRAARSAVFTTTAHLRQMLAELAVQPTDGLFHAAAVSDFAFGKVWLRSAGGELHEVKSGKLSTRQGTLLAELVPTPKIIASLRHLFPRARLVGWKYEVDGSREEAVQAAERQLAECRTSACVVNGPAYGPGFGLLPAGGSLAPLENETALFEALEGLLAGAAPGSPP